MAIKTMIVPRSASNGKSRCIEALASKVVACALQQYGAFVTDNGPAFNIYFQNVGSTGGAWATWNIPDELAKIPVNRFRVLDGITAVKY
jgi:hypothetical protein